MEYKTEIFTLTQATKRAEYINQIWKLLVDGYKNVKGGLFFTNKENLLNTTVKWKLIIYKNEVVAVTIYKAKKGLKLVAMSATKITAYRKIALNALTKLIKEDLKICWMELSESAEKFVMKFAKDFVVPNKYVSEVIEKDIVCSSDGVHYKRIVKNIEKEKILLGSFEAKELKI